MSSETMKLLSAETRLVGKWIEKGGRVVSDSTCERIRHLTDHVLLKIAISPTSGAWETLFKDPDDGRLNGIEWPGAELTASVTAPETEFDARLPLLDEVRQSFKWLRH